VALLWAKVPRRKISVVRFPLFFCFHERKPFLILSRTGDKDGGGTLFLGSLALPNIYRSADPGLDPLKVFFGLALHPRVVMFARIRIFPHPSSFLKNPLERRVADSLTPLVLFLRGQADSLFPFDRRSPPPPLLKPQPFTFLSVFFFKGWNFSPVFPPPSPDSVWISLLDLLESPFFAGNFLFFFLWPLLFGNGDFFFFFPRKCTTLSNPPPSYLTSPHGRRRRTNPGRLLEPKGPNLLFLRTEFALFFPICNITSPICLSPSPTLLWVIPDSSKIVWSFPSLTQTPGWSPSPVSSNNQAVPQTP